MFFNVAADCDYLVLVTSHVGGKARPHKIECWSPENRQYLTDWITGWASSDSWTQFPRDNRGCDWLKLGNTVQVYHEGELLEEVTQVPYVSHLSEVKYSVCHWEDQCGYDDGDYDDRTYTSLPEALSDYRWSSPDSYPGLSLSCVHRNGCSTEITPQV